MTIYRTCKIHKFLFKSIFLFSLFQVLIAWCHSAHLAGASSRQLKEKVLDSSSQTYLDLTFLFKSAIRVLWLAKNLNVKSKTYTFYTFFLYRFSIPPVLGYRPKDYLEYSICHIVPIANSLIFAGINVCIFKTNIPGD